MYATRSGVTETSPPQFNLANPIVWHIGISPGFPSSLLLSNEAAVETVLSAIPLISVGILGFAVATFFFFLHKFNYASAPVFASIMTGFIASVLDIGQLLIRGSTATNGDTKLELVLPYLIAREVFLALSIGFRYLFYLVFIALPPLGEKPQRRRQTHDMPLKFLRTDNKTHSANWQRWGLFGFVSKYVLLAAVISFTALELLWRLVARFSNFGGIYRSAVILEIAMAGVFILKLFLNAWVSPLRPRWKTVGNYLPIIIALLFRLAVAVGDIIQFQFSESSLGRFLQALEIYVLILYLLISSFYGQTFRRSILDLPGEKLEEAISPLDGSDSKPPNTSFSFPSKEKTHIPNKPSTRLSSWLMEIDSSRTTTNAITDGTSMARRMSSWLTMGRQSRIKSNGLDLEGGISPGNEVTRLSVSRTGGFPSQKPPEEGIGQQSSGQPAERLEQLVVGLKPTTAERSNLEAPKGILKVSPRSTVNSPVPSSTSPPEGLNRSVYETGAIMNYYAPGSVSNSVRSSSSMASLLRQQAELDKSVAELQLFRDSITTEPTNTQRPIESYKSDFSLSNFPKPPSEVGNSAVDGESEIGSRYSLSENPRLSSTVNTVPDMRFSRRPLSFPSALRASGESSLLGASERPIVNNSGTQYDVTSFIGDLSVPIAKETAAAPVQSKEANDSESAKIGMAEVVTVPRTMRTIAAGQTSTKTPQRKPGLPSGVKLKISNPIPATNVDKETAYERPRPVPST